MAHTHAHGGSHRHGRRHGHDHGHAHGLSGHGHGDSDYTHRAAPAGARPLALAFGLTAGYSLVEAAGGLWSGSLALLADAGHMATDAAALLFALAANLIARQPASSRHSYGLARVEVVAAFVNALAMLAVVGWIFVEAIDRLRAPVPVQGIAVLGVASVGLGINLVVAWVLSRERDNVNTRAAYLHVLGDLLGSVAAIASGVIVHFSGFMQIDPLLSMFVGGLILRSTFGVLRQTTLVLLDSVPEEVDYAEVGRALAQVPGVVSVHDLHVWSMVPGRSALSAHVLIDDVDRWPQILNAARARLRSDFGLEHVTLQPEWLPKNAGGRVIRLRQEPKDEQGS
jgi:cobalt-zinc-cadmium efflux system protein